MEVVVGTYEELILGYKLVPREKGFKFELNFTNHSHTGCVKSVGVSERGILATGSTDEVIRLFNLTKHIEIGALMHHDGQPDTSVQNSHFSVLPWGAVNSFSVHPTGKMALSVGQDRKLRVWNLMTGKCAFIKNIKQEADHIKWSPSGSSYLVIINNKVDIYDLETAQVTHTTSMTGRISAVQFLTDDVVVLGGEEGKLKMYNIKTDKGLLDFSTNTTRIKGFACSTEPDGFLLVTASSDGFLKAWQLKKQGDQTYNITSVGEIQTKFRLTCCTMFSYEDGNQQVKQTNKAKEYYNQGNKEKDLEKKDRENDDTDEWDIVKDIKADKSKHKDSSEKSQKRIQTSESTSLSKRRKPRMEESSREKLKKKQKIKRLKPTRT
ncbi:hypothetical protein LSH36_657g01029 [Paralvinella palmiformis]|uniref:P21-activated protein kinase-interacting protein 1-like n=1 Tax=Paralvinella palmiformis TaxID=53620 RepID=A0AAD9J4B6_9ANNE|nr:hypothetical protein LSH36_657g01029 [Paralvinella palmiformis]